MTASKGLRSVKPWSAEDDEVLSENHGEMTIQEIAGLMGRSTCSVRARITRLGIAKRRYWTAGDISALVELYTKAGPDGVLRLKDFARDFGKSLDNISRKARELGLPTNLNRRVVHERQQRVRKYANDEEMRAAISLAAKARIVAHGHPRGMAGKHHSPETRAALSKTSTAAQLLVPPDVRSQRVLKAMKATVAARGSVAPNVARGSWKAGWREIGDNRKYYRSRWEANYARYLQWLKERGQISEWKHEPETFWFESIKRGVRSYLPDFRVWEINGETCLHEVKGWMDARSRTTLKRMAKYYPEQKIILIDGRQYRAIRSQMMGLIPGWEDSARDSHA